MSITVQTGIPARSQESSFANATLQSAGTDHAMSISVTLPSGAAEKAGIDLDDAGRVSDWLAAVFASAIAAGCEIEVKVGPEDD